MAARSRDPATGTLDGRLSPEKVRPAAEGIHAAGRRRYPSAGALGQGLRTRQKKRVTLAVSKTGLV